jgi:predicted NBD/HSP70 family sugar kinase
VNPQTIVLGGSVMNAGSLLTRSMRLALERSSWESSRRMLRIVSPALGQDAGLIGGLEWARLHARA